MHLGRVESLTRVLDPYEGHDGSSKLYLLVSAMLG